MISGTQIEVLLNEDVPYGDLTTTAMGIADKPGFMAFATRSNVVVAGVEEAAAVLRGLGLEVEVCHRSGDVLLPKTLVLQARGPAGLLHCGWKVAQNLLEYCSGIATRTHDMVVKGRAVNPHLQIAATRKNFPGTKSLSAKAVLAGGGIIHRLGLSESFLLFDNHHNFFSSPAQLFAAVAAARRKLPEKKICVEVKNFEDAVQFAQAGAHVLQFDKNSPEELREWIPRIREKYPVIVIAAAGGVNADNIQNYARTGIDLVVTSWVYFGKPADIAVCIQAS